MQLRWMVPGLAAALAGMSYGASAAPFDSAAPLRTPYARSGSLSFRSVSVAPQSVPAYGRVEVTIDADATFDNPFDAGDVALDARIVAPSRKVHEVPGFYYQPYRRELKNGAAILTPAGKPGWKVRFTPTEPGVHVFSLRLRDRTGVAAATNRRFVVTSGKSPGFVRVSERDPRFFAFDSGGPFYPLGANAPEAGAKGDADLDGWFAQLARVGGNSTRLSLAASPSFALERMGKADEGRGIGQFDLASAWRVDQALEAARRRGVYLTLVLEESASLRADAGLGGRWAESPLNARNSGPLAKPVEFWTSQPMAGLFKNKLRYLVARYGASPNLLAWELWSEPEATDGYRSALAHDWFEDVSEELRKLDPYDHLITTSFARPGGDSALEKLEDLDFVQMNVFSGSDPAAAVAAALRAHGRLQKPVLVGEVGASRWSSSADRDPKGLEIHDPLWASAGLASAGGAHYRWPSAAPTQPVFRQLAAVHRFVAGINWPEESFKAVPGRTGWVKPPAAASRLDLQIATSSEVTGAPEAYRPRTLLVPQTGAAGQLPVPSILHGVHARPELHQPLRFRTDLPWPTRFEVQVRTVSAQGGAALRIMLDGANVLEKDFVVRERGGVPVQRFAGSYGVALSPGKHTIQVENVGEDWLEAGYTFREARAQATPPLEVWSSAGRTTALAWIRPADRTWHRLCELKAPVRPVPSTRLLLPGLAPGKWKAELWDTWAGRLLQRQEVTVNKSGTASVLLPALQQDVAVKLRREGASLSRSGKRESHREERHERKRRVGEEEDDD